MCFPGWNLSGLVWLWMLPLLPAVWRGQSKWYGFFICYLSGVTFWLINLKWLWTVSGLGALVMAAFLALYFGLWGAIAVSIGNPWRKKLSKNNDDPNEREGIREKIANKQAALNRGQILVAQLVIHFVHFVLLSLTPLLGWGLSGCADGCSLDLVGMGSV